MIACEPRAFVRPVWRRTAWRTREGNPEGELRLLNFLAKLQNLEIGFCNVDRHKCDLDPHSKLNHKPIAWLGHNVTMEPATICEMPYKWACLVPRFLPRAGDGRLNACGLSLVYRRTPRFTAKTK